MASISNTLNSTLDGSKFNFIPITITDCWYLPGFNKVNYKTTKVYEKCNLKIQNKIKKYLFFSKNSIIILGGNLPQQLSRKNFDNQEGGIRDDDTNYRFVHHKNHA